MLKLSVCMLYWHLFAQLKFRHFLIFWIVVIALWTASFSIALFAECGNHFLALFAQPEDYTLHCGAAIPGGWAYVGTDVFTDIATLIIPIPVVLELQMSRQLKVLSILVFSIGAL
jgi:hypothetical protein